MVATFNAHKLAEILAVLPELPVKFKALGAFPGARPAVEDGETLEANALKKAASAARFTGLWALADDTGLEVDALCGAPGVLSARYAGPAASYAANNARLLAALAGLPPERRTARFACAAALVSPAGENFLSRGALEGRITAAPRGGGGFGYDPLFEIAGLFKTLAEITTEEKNSLSHRAKALELILPHIRALL